MLAKTLGCVLALCCFACGQILYLDQEVRVPGLPSLMARTHDPSDILLTSLDTILHDRDICCGKDSALVDSAEAADPNSLKDIAGKLGGRHLLGDGRPIMVTAEFLAPDAVSAAHLIQMLTDKHAALMEWNSHLYVVQGLVYFWTGDSESGPHTVIRKFLLLDTRYTDWRREVVFTRGVDDTDKVQGLLFLQVKPQ
jgi:hypothetical protein